MGDLFQDPGHDRYYTPDENKENNDPGHRKKEIYRPALRSDFLGHKGGGLRLQYEKAVCSSNMPSGAEISSIVRDHLEEAREKGSKQSFIPKDYLQSLVRDNETITCQEWYNLVDIIAMLSEAVFISLQEENRCLSELNSDLQAEMVYKHKICEKVLQILEEPTKSFESAQPSEEVVQLLEQCLLPKPHRKANKNPANENEPGNVTSELENLSIDQGK